LLCGHGRKGRLQPVVIERVAGDHKGRRGGDADREVFRENLPNYIHAREPPPHRPIAGNLTCQCDNFGGILGRRHDAPSVLQIINSEIPAKPNIGGASLRASLSVTAVRGITATCRPVAGLDIKRPTISHSDLSSLEASGMDESQSRHPRTRLR
jgi:hypothetical protein